MNRLVFQPLLKSVPLLHRQTTGQGPYPRLGLSGHSSPFYSSIAPCLTSTLQTVSPPSSCLTSAGQHDAQGQHPALQVSPASGRARGTAVPRASQGTDLITPQASPALRLKGSAAFPTLPQPDNTHFSQTQSLPGAAGLTLQHPYNSSISLAEAAGTETLLLWNPDPKLLLHPDLLH